MGQVSLTWCSSWFGLRTRRAGFLLSNRSHFDGASASSESGLGGSRPIRSANRASIRALSSVPLDTDPSFSITMSNALTALLIFAASSGLSTSRALFRNTSTQVPTGCSPTSRVSTSRLMPMPSQRAWPKPTCLICMGIPMHITCCSGWRSSPVPGICHGGRHRS